MSTKNKSKINLYIKSIKYILTWIYKSLILLNILKYDKKSVWLSTKNTIKSNIVIYQYLIKLRYIYKILINNDIWKRFGNLIILMKKINYRKKI